jgi:hypothetical protein
MLCNCNAKQQTLLLATVTTKCTPKKTAVAVAVKLREPDEEHSSKNTLR